MREQLNSHTTELVNRGFQAIDQAAERAKDYAKRKILEALTGKKQP
jgi:hypothetical protein